MCVYVGGCFQAGECACVRVEGIFIENSRNNEDETKRQGEREERLELERERKRENG